MFSFNLVQNRGFNVRCYIFLYRLANLYQLKMLPCVRFSLFNTLTGILKIKLTDDFYELAFGTITTSSCTLTGSCSLSIGGQTRIYNYFKRLDNQEWDRYGKISNRGLPVLTDFCYFVIILMRLLCGIILLELFLLLQMWSREVASMRTSLSLAVLCLLMTVYWRPLNLVIKHVMAYNSHR